MRTTLVAGALPDSPVSPDDSVPCAHWRHPTPRSSRTHSGTVHRHNVDDDDCDESSHGPGRSRRTVAAPPGSRLRLCWPRRSPVRRSASFSDTFGRRLIFTVTIAIYVLGAAIATTAGSTWQLVAGLGVLGIGIGGLLVMSQVLLSDLTTPRERGRYIGYIVMGYAAGSLSGPLIGGVLVEMPGLGWRTCSLTVTVVAAGSLAMVYPHLPGRQGTGTRLPVDVLRHGVPVGDHVELPRARQLRRATG
ncbi:MFS transporter [Aeromicrobium sp. UC242_57]|uniref:MFS transporter n=1 Tax=Aeromicrobium sp. UC242_57 TaxID=3374624 RepID=UPI0037880EF2